MSDTGRVMPLEGGDAVYIRDAREIQDNIRNLVDIATLLSVGVKANQLHAQLEEAKDVAVRTHALLKRFGKATSASSDCYGTERNLRRQTHKRLNHQYQAALKSLDLAAAGALARPVREKNAKHRHVSEGDRVGKTSRAANGATSALLSASSSSSVSSDDELEPNRSRKAQSVRGWDNESCKSLKKENGHPDRHRSHNHSGRDAQQSRSTASIWGRHPQESNAASLLFPEDRTARAKPTPLGLRHQRLWVPKTYLCYGLADERQWIGGHTAAPISRGSDRRLSSAWNTSLIELENQRPLQRFSSPTDSYQQLSGGEDEERGTVYTNGVSAVHSSRDVISSGSFPIQVVDVEALRAERLAEKTRGVLQIEKDVRGIRELYKAMAWQVDNTTDDLDAIESQMRSALMFSDSGVNELSGAHNIVRIQRRRRRFLYLVVLGSGFLFFLLYILLRS